jgi:hypothetical protein
MTLYSSNEIKNKTILEAQKTFIIN